MNKAGKITLLVLATIGCEVLMGYLMAFGVYVTKFGSLLASYWPSVAVCAIGVTIFMIGLFLIVGLPFVFLNFIINAAKKPKVQKEQV